MLSKERNALLTQVGPGAPMGDLLRRYWHPIAGISEFSRTTVKAIRLFGEDLVLYKDQQGRFGLIDRYCPHRRADLANGYVESTGLRCSYHGWQFDHEGRCVHQPFEEAVDAQARLRKRTRVTSYPVQTKAGMVWAYLGPQPAPQIPDWEPFHWDNCFAQVVLTELPCNWLQGQENAIDPVHFEWLHNNWNQRMRNESGPYSPTHIKLHFEEFEHGFIFKRVRADHDDSARMWEVGRAMLYPNAFYLGHHLEWRVPIDDENTLNIIWVAIRVPTEAEPYRQAEIPAWRGPLKDEHGEWINTHILNQDFLTWAGQGTITDRSRESLGASDKGIAMFRLRLMNDLTAIAEGKDPKGVIRNAACNRQLLLPSAVREEMIHGLSAADMARNPHLGPFLVDFFLQAGQPEAVRAEFERAIGRKLTGGKYFRVHGSGVQDETPAHET